MEKKYSNIISHSKPSLDSYDLSSLKEQLDSNQIASGSKNYEFEIKLKEYLNKNFVKLTSNGSNAIYLALCAFDLKAGDEVIIPSYVCKNVEDAVKLSGCKPVYCDLDKNSWVIDAKSVKRVLTSKTKAIIVVHSLGVYSEINQILKLGLNVIEDSCQFFYPTKTTKKSKLITIYSFHATKCLSTGEGGAITTNNKFFEEKIKSVISKKCLHNPLSDLQCALGLSQLNKYNSFLVKRKEIADYYFKNIDKKLTDRFFKFKTKSIFFRFLLYCDKINYLDFKSYMKENNIEVRKGVDNLLKNGKNFKNSELTLKNTISIPIYPSLTENEIKKIVKLISNYEF